MDQSAVHPEAYPVVENIIKLTGQQIDQLIGKTEVLRKIDPAQLSDEKFGEPTIRDILQELEKPGRDPRPEFKTATFADGIEKPSDLKPNMRLEGVVTNVTNFGAFVDVGVHQDGLVHISQLADKFVKDPHEIVKPGDIVQVKVLEVDLKRNRISLTMKMQDTQVKDENSNAKQNSISHKQKNTIGSSAKLKMGTKLKAEPVMQGGNAMAEALAKAGLKRK